jgi:hypothetical protein
MRRHQDIVYMGILSKIKLLQHVFNLTGCINLDKQKKIITVPAAALS